ncbi:hypothetical protein AB0L00_28930 [Actinoallomurus sp. NPDC052308]|uniref:hypothetical protein n=1 Tax=Actinoallomurus sp. NPDC052308 TaxID=3155530 RepID=UPI0034444F49
MSHLKKCLLAGMSVCLLISGCSGHGDSGDHPSKLPKNFIRTDAKIPDPCGLISPALSEELIGLKVGRQTNTPEPNDASTDVECRWDNGGLKGEHRKQGTINLSAHVDLMRVVGGDPYSGAKIHYRSYTAGKKCNAIPVEASETCWYVESGVSLGVVLQKNYSTIWLTCDASDSPSLASKNLSMVASRAAAEILAKLS